MNRISKAFEKNKAFIAFVTGGDPDLDTTEALIPQMAQAGADLIEIGIPFSDPIAEGVVIQAADERALKAGTTTDKLFDMVRRVRKKTEVPLVFMTYINPIYTYGAEKFMKRCVECGIDGIIVPDVPFEEREEISAICESAGIKLISMIAPTSKERICMIAKQAKGFLYCHWRPQSNYNQYRRNGAAGKSGFGYSVRCRIWDSHTTAGAGNGIMLRRSDCGKCNRENRCKIWKGMYKTRL